MSGAFNRRRRLRTAADYRRVFDRPERIGNRYFTALLRNNESAEARLGLAIARKAVRRAVDRNRIKRLVRESFRQHQHGLGGLDIVILARPGISSNTNAELFAALADLWRRASAIGG